MPVVVRKPSEIKRADEAVVKEYDTHVVYTTATGWEEAIADWPYEKLSDLAESLSRLAHGRSSFFKCTLRKEGTSVHGSASSSSPRPTGSPTLIPSRRPTDSPTLPKRSPSVNPSTVPEQIINPEASANPLPTPAPMINPGGR